jgi:hypothetical protein
MVLRPNFVSKNTKSDKETVLKGTEGKRIVCFQFKRTENHFFCFGWKRKYASRLEFHLVGKDSEDDLPKNKEPFQNKHLEHVVLFTESAGCKKVF